MSVSIVTCILCDGAIPAEEDEAFLNHMQEQHRSYYNLDFMFAAFFLSTGQRSLIEDCMKKITNNNTLEEEVRCKFLVPQEEIKFDLKVNKEEEDNATIFREIEESLQYNDSMKLENLEPIVQLEENIENDDKLESKLDLESIKSSLGMDFEKEWIFN